MSTVNLKDSPTLKAYNNELTKPDMRIKVKEFITELDEEIDRVEQWIEDNVSCEACKVSEMEGRVTALYEVKNDLKNRLDGGCIIERI